MDGERLELRDTLLASGVLCELNLSADHEQIARLIVEGLAKVKNPADIKGQAIEFDKAVRQQVEEFLDADTANFLNRAGKLGDRQNLFDTIDHGLKHSRMLAYPVVTYTHHG